MKRLIQTYKGPKQWVNSPPGLGDFVRGIASLFEMLQGSGIELKVDISQTDFASLIVQDDTFFHQGEVARIAQAEEYFVDHVALRNRLLAFLHSEETELYVCTNLGAWNRLSLPEPTRVFTQKFYRFNDEIERMNAEALRARDYEVLSIRCGDRFYSDPTGTVGNEVKPLICSLIEQQILPNAKLPIVITSDCHELKCELAQRYGMLTLPHRSQHGAFGNALPVAMDMCMLKNSQFNYHINSWATWWSGFSHYTSIVFQIPSMNFRAPNFAREKVTIDGQLQLASTPD